MQECAHKLMAMGMDEDEIRENLFGSKQLKDLIITKNGEVTLSYQTGIFIRKDIVKLAPLDKAIYLLFLRHPKGINFSYLPDYREELMEIYKKLMNYRTTASMRKSVEDVTDPTKNSSTRSVPASVAPSSMCWVITWPRPTTFPAIEVKRRRLCWTDVGCIGRSDVKYLTQST